MAFELPEAVTVARQMDRAFNGKTIQHVTLSEDCASLIRQGFVNLDRVDLAGKTIGPVTSQGKWIFMRLGPDWFLLFALESGGKILYYPSGADRPEKFRVLVEFISGQMMAVHIQGWGFARAARESDLPDLSYPGKLGVSPLDDAQFSSEEFNRLLERNQNKILKAVITDQRQIAGIGIGYFQEIAYRAHLHPKRKVRTLSPDDRARLFAAIRSTLADAVAMGGSAGEVDLYNHPGGYQRQMSSHLLGLPCPRCRTVVEKINVAGAFCCVCPGCQE